MIRRRPKQATRQHSPIFRGCECKFFLRFKVVEKAALGQASLLTDVLDPRGSVAFGADDMQRRVEKFCFRFVLSSTHNDLHLSGAFCIPTGWYVVNAFFFTLPSSNFRRS